MEQRMFFCEAQTFSIGVFSGWLVYDMICQGTFCLFVGFNKTNAIYPYIYKDYDIRNLQRVIHKHYDDHGDVWGPGDLPSRFLGSVPLRHPLAVGIRVESNTKKQYLLVDMAEQKKGPESGYLPF